MIEHYSNYMSPSHDIAEKLDRIRARVKPLTKRKVELITSQLERKYELLSYSTSSSVDLLNVVHWYRKQPPEVRTSLDEAEPSTWMKHLWDRQGHVRPWAGNSTWSPTALVMTEYVKAHLSPRGMDTIPENAAKCTVAAGCFWGVGKQLRSCV